MADVERIDELMAGIGYREISPRSVQNKRYIEREKTIPLGFRALWARFIPTDLRVGGSVFLTEGTTRILAVDGYQEPGNSRKTRQNCVRTLYLSNLSLADAAHSSLRIDAANGEVVRLLSTEPIGVPSWRTESSLGYEFNEAGELMYVPPSTLETRQSAASRLAAQKEMYHNLMDKLIKLSEPMQVA